MYVMLSAVRVSVLFMLKAKIIRQKATSMMKKRPRHTQMLHVHRMVHTVISIAPSVRQDSTTMQRVKKLQQHM